MAARKSGKKIIFAIFIQLLCVVLTAEQLIQVRDIDWLCCACLPQPNTLSFNADVREWYRANA